MNNKIFTPAVMATLIGDILRPHPVTTVANELEKVLTTKVDWYARLRRPTIVPLSLLPGKKIEVAIVLEKTLQENAESIIKAVVYLPKQGEYLYISGLSGVAPVWACHERVDERAPVASVLTLFSDFTVAEFDRSM
jgi:hypothetical protein